MSRTTTFTVWLLLASAMMAGTTGCWSGKFLDPLSLKKRMPWHDEEEEMKEGTPVRMACTWIDTVRHQDGEPPQRGFGGRILFYDRQSNDPIKVNGMLVVYAFDESDRDVLDNRPTRRYVFPPEQIELHMSKSSVGPSYSFFLPWDQAGGPQTEISLICRFQPRDGGVVISEQTRHLLPGALPPGAALAGKGAQPRRPAVESQPHYQRMVYEAQGGPSREVQQAGLETAEVPTGPRRMITTSISLPENFRLPAATSAERVAAAEPRSGRPTLPRPPSAPASTNAAAKGQPMPGHSHPGGPALGRQPFVPIGKAEFSSPLAVLSANPTAATMPAHAEAATGQPWSAAQPMPNQAPQMATLPPQSMGTSPGGAKTTVSYLSPQESRRWEQEQRSSGSTPLSPQAPWPPAAR